VSAAQVKFTKMSAGGNDFVVIDNVTASGPEAIGVDEDFVRRVCARALSVGADGVIVIEPSEKAHVRMVYYNRDGGRAALCGNGVRCVARMSAIKRLAPSDGMIIETDVGPLAAAVPGDTPWFRLPLGRPEIRPVSLMLEGSLDEVSRAIDGTFVEAGVPHLVVQARNAHAMPDREFLALAARLRRHPEFGDAGTNVDFISPHDRSTLDIRCFERGVEAETLSSGTGCIASAIAATRAGLAESPVACRSRSGLTASVTLEEKEGGALEAVLSGDARVIYTGVLHPEALAGFAP
jgi:diaminopimelate epimerase